VIDLSHDAAQAIVAEARSMGVKVDYGPDTVIQVAERLIESAREAHKQGVRGDHVTRILHMAEGGEIAVEQNNAVQQEQLTQEQEKLALSSRPGYEASDAARARIKAEGLPIPVNPQGDPSPITRDLTELSDRTVRKLHGENNAYLVRTFWLLGVEKSDLASAKQVHSWSKGEILAKLDRIDHDTQKPKLLDILNAEADFDGKVLEWAKRVQEHEANIALLLALRDVYQSNVDRLSREWTMRTDSWEREGKPTS